MFTYYKLIVAGGRGFSDYKTLSAKLNTIRNIILADDLADDLEIVCGKARGADTLGEKWGKANHVGIEYFPADWDKFNKAAGYIRNEEMAKYGDALLACWDGKSKGTGHMIDLAKKYNLPVMLIKY